MQGPPRSPPCVKAKVTTGNCNRRNMRGVESWCHQDAMSELNGVKGPENLYQLES